MDKVQLLDGRGVEGNVVGTVHVTTSHLIFKAEDRSKEIWVRDLSLFKLASRLLEKALDDRRSEAEEIDEVNKKRLHRSTFRSILEV